VLDVLPRQNNFNALNYAAIAPEKYMQMRTNWKGLLTTQLMLMSILCAGHGIARDVSEAARSAVDKNVSEAARSAVDKHMPRLPAAVLNIAQLGPERLAVLQADARVRWSIEAGTELLIAVENIGQAETLATDFNVPLKRRLAPIDRGELYFREHACLEDRKLPSVDVLGGFELLRAPASLVKTNLLYNDRLIALPDSNVLSYAAANRAPSLQPKALRSGNIQALVDRISALRWRNAVLSLSGFNRNTFNEELNQAHDWIFGQFAALGLNTQSFEYAIGANVCPGSQALTRRNPIGVKLGVSRPNEWIVIGAHYDSRNINRCEGAGVQPGANDNASGCAGVLELAAAFQDVQTERTLVFTCFSGEEQGLLGSNQYVNSLIASGDIGKVKLMVNLDMLGHDPEFIQKARIETLVGAQNLYPIFANAAQLYAPELTLIQATTTAAYSDHWYFLQAGVPAIFTWEDGAAIYPQYHTELDTLSNMTNASNLAGGILRMDAAVIAGQAQLVNLYADGFE
jgi:Peptidase family M28